MSKEVFSLPASSLGELEKIIKGYAHIGNDADLTSLANLLGMHRGVISPNNGFLSQVGLIIGGKKKSATDKGKELGRALDQNRIEDVRRVWREIIKNNEVLAGFVTTVRLRGGVSTEGLAKHILNVSGQNDTKHNRTGSRAIVDLLIFTGLLEEEEGKVVVAAPKGSNQDTPVVNEEVAAISDDIPQAEDKVNLPAEVTSNNSKDVPMISINIQLQLPETDNPDVYNNLFKSLSKHLLHQDG